MIVPIEFNLLFVLVDSELDWPDDSSMVDANM
jgi:hypothetical protein